MLGLAHLGVELDALLSGRQDGSDEGRGNLHHLTFTLARHFAALLVNRNVIKLVAAELSLGMVLHAICYRLWQTLKAILITTVTRKVDCLFICIIFLSSRVTKRSDDYV